MNTAMNMRTISKIAGMAFSAILLLTAVSCSTSDDEISDDPIEPKKTIDVKPGTDEAPDWTVKENLYTENELTMSVVIKLQNELNSYASTEDQMCAVINDEVRAVSKARQLPDGTIYFPLIIASSIGGEQIAVKYYCSKLKRIYTNSNWQKFNSDISPTADGKYYVVTFF